MTHACPPEAVFLRAALLAEALAKRSEREGKDDAAEQQREVAAKMRSLLPRKTKGPGAA